MSKAIIPKNDSVKSHDYVDFLIVTALEKERNAVLQQLGYPELVPEDGPPPYYRSILDTGTGPNQVNCVVAVTLADVGNVNAGLHTASCIQHLQPHYVFMVGIAGGLSEDVTLGDVVVSNQVIYYEIAKETPAGSKPYPKETPVNRKLLNGARSYNTDWHTFIRAKRPNGPTRNEVPRVHFAPIASGEKVKADANRASELKQWNPKLAAVEMESFGVGEAAARSDNSSRFIAFRGISDYADESKNDDWQEYAADSAAAFTVGFLRSGAIPVQVDTQSRHQTGKTLVAIRHQSMEPLDSRLNAASLPETLKSANVEEVVIDQTDLYHNGRLTNPMEAARRQKDIAYQLSEVLNTYPEAKIGYYGIAHIPLLFHIGGQLQNRKRIHFFDYNRKTDEWDQLQRGGNYPHIRLEGLPDVISQECGDVVVRVSISYPITPEVIEGIVPNPIASIHLSINQPKIGVVTSMKQIKQYSDVFRGILDTIHNKLPNTECVHIFYSGPVALAVNFGRQISKTIHPRIIVYNHSSKNNPRYAWGLEVTADVDSSDFMIRTGD